MMNYTEKLMEAEQLATAYYCNDLDMKECIGEIFDYYELSEEDAIHMAGHVYEVMPRVTNE